MRVSRSWSGSRSLRANLTLTTDLCARATGMSMRCCTATFPRLSPVSCSPRFRTGPGACPLQGRPLLGLVDALARRPRLRDVFGRDRMAGGDAGRCMLPVARRGGGRARNHCRTQMEQPQRCRSDPACSLRAMSRSTSESRFHGAADTSIRIGIAVVVMLISLIGGRIIPSFTRNWLARENPGRLPAPFRLGSTCSSSTVGALVRWCFGWSGLTAAANRDTLLGWRAVCISSVWAVGPAIEPGESV